MQIISYRIFSTGHYRSMEIISRLTSLNIILGTCMHFVFSLTLYLFNIRSSAENMQRTWRQDCWWCTNRHTTGSVQTHNWNPPPQENQTFLVSFPRSEGPLACPVERWQGQEEIQMGLTVHSVHHHIHDTMVIVEEGNPYNRISPDMTCWYRGMTYMTDISTHISAPQERK